MKCPKCGHNIEGERSSPQHRRFFKLIAVAFDNWPERHAFQPSNPEHLRAWLLIKADHYTTKTVPFDFDEKHYRKLAILLVEQSIMASGAYPFMRPQGDAITIAQARSISYKALPHKQFQPIAQAVDEILEGIFKISTDDLLREHERAA